jgi:hypothetical protein
MITKKSRLAYIPHLDRLTVITATDRQAARDQAEASNGTTPADLMRAQLRAAFGLSGLGFAAEIHLGPCSGTWAPVWTDELGEPRRPGLSDHPDFHGGAEMEAPLDWYMADAGATELHHDTGPDGAWELVIG